MTSVVAVVVIGVGLLAVLASVLLVTSKSASARGWRPFVGISAGFLLIALGLLLLGDQGTPS